MDDAMLAAVITLYGDVLVLLKTDEERMAKLEEFDETFGVECPTWEERMKESVAGKDGAEAAVKAIDAFHDKYHVYDENGNRIYERFRFGSSLHQIVMTFDSNAPDGDQISLREIPDLESMDLKALKEYYDEAESIYSELEDEEPEDEDSEEHRRWEREFETAEEMMEEIESRIIGMGGQV